MDLAVKRQMAVFQPYDRGVADPSLFAFDHRLLGQTVVPAASVLHFDKAEGFILAYDNIDLAQCTTEIMVDDVVFHISKMLPGEFFTKSANGRSVRSHSNLKDLRWIGEEPYLRMQARCNFVG